MTPSQAAQKKAEEIVYAKDGAPAWGLDVEMAEQLATLITQTLDAWAPQWRPIETAPKDTAVLLYSSWAYEIGHFNTTLQIWAACWDHRRLTRVTHWQPLPPSPEPKE